MCVLNDAYKQTHLILFIYDAHVIDCLCKTVALINDFSNVSIGILQVCSYACSECLNGARQFEQWLPKIDGQLYPATTR